MTFDFTRTMYHDEFRVAHPIVSCFKNVRSESQELRGPAVSDSVVAERSGLLWKGVVCYRSRPFKGSGLSELPCFGRDLRQNTANDRFTDPFCGEF